MNPINTTFDFGIVQPEIIQVTIDPQGLYCTQELCSGLFGELRSFFIVSIFAMLSMYHLGQRIAQYKSGDIQRNELFKKIWLDVCIILAYIGFGLYELFTLSSFLNTGVIVV